MRYRLEYSSQKNVLTIHLDRRFENIRDFFEKEEDGVEHPTLARDLLNIDGVRGIIFELYSVDIFKGEVFNWDEIIPATLYYLNVHFASEEKMEETGSPLGLESEERGTSVSEHTTADGQI